MKNGFISLCWIFIVATQCQHSEIGTQSVTKPVEQFNIVSTKINNSSYTASIQNISVTPTITLEFSSPVDQTSLKNSISLSGGNTMQTTFLKNDSVVNIMPTRKLQSTTDYLFWLAPTVKSATGKVLGGDGVTLTFKTEFDSSPKFPTITDDELLTKIQQQTFKYFYDFAHPASGMAREGSKHADYIVTTGGSGFGIMALIVGVERKFITRAQGIEIFTRIITFLEKADRFHGVWSHWVNGDTGKVIPFGTKDNGGDLVESSFLLQGLLTLRQYLNPNDATEKALIDRINVLWRGVEFDWYRKDNSNVLYWHWSPNYNWDMNFPLRGFFEEQITYILAAASPTHSIPKEVYTQGYAQNGAIKNSQTFYNIPIQAGGLFPLFWVHYSYLGMNPHFSDEYIDYWQQAVSASKINYAYCVANPKKYLGYGENCWGLTASNIPNGYTASAPNNDVGVIAPTAALSSFPYTPEESMRALKYFYYTVGDKLLGQYGFYDAFSLSQNWFADEYLAIDQGPIVVMMENYRTGLLWKLFMSCPELEQAKTKLNLTYTR